MQDNAFSQSLPVTFAIRLLKWSALPAEDMFVNICRMLCLPVTWHIRIQIGDVRCRVQCQLNAMLHLVQDWYSRIYGGWRLEYKLSRCYCNYVILLEIPCWFKHSVRTSCDLLLQIFTNHMCQSRMSAHFVGSNCETSSTSLSPRPERHCKSRRSNGVLSQKRNTHDNNILRCR